jgi:hypothetical protein
MFLDNYRNAFCWPDSEHCGSTGNFIMIDVAFESDAGRSSIFEACFDPETSRCRPLTGLASLGSFLGGRFQVPLASCSKAYYFSNFL